MAVIPSEAEANPGLDLNGAWFSCEFAHSKISPEDGCRMLDDDGFLVTGNAIDHIKVKNSRETGCRHERIGQCFERGFPKITVERDSVGEFRLAENGFIIEYWGCSQRYLMSEKDGFYEVKPKGDSCVWTRDKTYYIARFSGDIEFTD